MTTHSQNPRHPIIIVTGANSGVGFGICHRLLVQLSRPSTPRTLPRLSYNGLSFPSPFLPTKHLTLILACRSPERAHTARQLLLSLVDKEVLCQRKVVDYDGHAEEFRRGLRIDCLTIDLANMTSIFEFAEDTNRRYPYISHLVLNAGVLNITGFNWGTVFWQLATEPVVAITTPRYLTQPVGTESRDGLGLTWQSNVFGHYTLFRLLEPLLLTNPYGDSRVEWLSSLDAVPADYDPTDPQLRQAQFPYQASKYQVDLLCTTLARTAPQKISQEDQACISHLLVHPGICYTPMVGSVLGYFLLMAKLLSFYVVRCLGSHNHPIQPYKGAVAAVYASLAPTAVLQADCDNAAQKFGSRTTLFGQEYVGTDAVLEWKKNVQHGIDLMAFCDRLFSTFVQKHGYSLSPTPTDSGIDIDQSISKDCLDVTVRT